MCEARMRKARRDIRTAKRRAHQLRQLRAFVENPTFPLPPQLPEVDTDSESDFDMQDDYLLKSDWPVLDDKSPQTVHLQQLADATISLMNRNSEIQRRVAELKLETASYVAYLMRNKEHRERFVKHLGAPQPAWCPRPSIRSAFSVLMSDDEDENVPNDEDVKDVSCEMELKNER